MANAAPARGSRNRAAERAAYDRLIERLRAMFPELAEEQIRRTVNGQYQEYEDSRVRDFVPVLVERRARQELAGLPTQHYRA